MKELEPCRAPGRSGRNLRRSGELSYGELQKGFGVLPEPTLSLVLSRFPCLNRWTSRLDAGEGAAGLDLEDVTWLEGLWHL